MNFLSELENRHTHYKSEADQLRNRLDHLDGLIANVTGLIEEERRQSQLPLLVDVNGQNSNDLMGYQSVSDAMFDIISRGTSKYLDILNLLRTDYPRIQAQHLDKGLSSALSIAVKKGRLRRLRRGVYERV